MGTWSTLHLQRILHAPGGISMHGGVSLASLELGLSGPELGALPTGRPQPLFENNTDVLHYGIN